MADDGAARPTVLLADDEAGITSNLAALLSRSGFDVTVRQRFSTVAGYAQPDGGTVTPRTMARRAAVLIAGLATLAACSAGTDDDADDTTAAPTETSTSTTPPTNGGAPTTTTETSTTAGVTATSAAPTTTSAPGGDAPSCLTGTWRLTELAPAPEVIDGLALSGTATGISVVFDQLNWTLVADNAVVQARYESVTAELGLDGEASGLVAVDGDTIRFDIDDADGDVSLSDQPAPFTFEQALVALVPSAEGALTCSGTTATITSETGTVTLTQAGGGTPTVTSPPAPSGSDPGGVVVTGPTVITKGGLTGTYTCGGYEVTVTSGGNDLTLTGDCPSVIVTGGGNTVKVERTDSINVTGSSNAVTWTAAINGTEPTIVDTGVGNLIAQG